MKNDNMPKVRVRSGLRIVFNDGTTKEFTVGHYTQILQPLEKVLLHIDKRKDGTVLIISGNDFVDDFSKVNRIEVIREDKETVCA